MRVRHKSGCPINLLTSSFDPLGYLFIYIYTLYIFIDTLYTNMSNNEDTLVRRVRELEKQLAQYSIQPQSSSTSNIAAVSVKLQNFFVEKPVIWFAQAEAQFQIAGITQDATKYGHILSVLDARVAEEVEDIIASPPTENRYEFLKKELIRRLSDSKVQRTRQLLSEEQLGDRKPSAFLRHLRSLAGTSVGDEGILRELWMRRLPPEVQRILMAQVDLPLHKVAEIADSIVETSPSTLQFVQSAAAVPADTGNLMRCIEELTRKVDALTRDKSRGHPQRSRSAGRTRSQSRSSSQGEHKLCWYHKRFQNKANKCISPCAWELLRNHKGNAPSNQ